MTAVPVGAVLVRRWDTSAASLARRNFERYGERTSPYASRPERETYTEFEDYRCDDGTIIRRERSCSRWGSIESEGSWSEFRPVA